MFSELFNEMLLNAKYSDTNVSCQSIEYSRMMKVGRKDCTMPENLRVAFIIAQQYTLLYNHLHKSGKQSLSCSLRR